MAYHFASANKLERLVGDFPLGLTCEQTPVMVSVKYRQQGGLPSQGLRVHTHSSGDEQRSHLLTLGSVQSRLATGACRMHLCPSGNESQSDRPVGSRE